MASTGGLLLSEPRAQRVVEPGDRRGTTEVGRRRALQGVYAKEQQQQQQQQQGAPPSMGSAHRVHMCQPGCDCACSSR